MIWRAKKCPVWSAGRWIHGWIGFTLPAAAWYVWGNPGLGWAAVVVLVGACAWEVSTPLLARRFGWTWPFGDTVDLAAFAAGVVVAAVAFGR